MPQKKEIIRISCTRPGLRRGGMRHPAGPVDHPAGSFGKAQLAQLEAEPAITLERLTLEAGTSDTNTQGQAGGRSGTAREASQDALGTDSGTQPAEPVSVGAQPAAHTHSTADPNGIDSGQPADQGGGPTAEGGAADKAAPPSSPDPKPATKRAATKRAATKKAAEGAGKS